MGRSAFAVFALLAALPGCDSRPVATTPDRSTLLGAFRPELRPGASVVEIQKHVGPRSVRYAEKVEDGDRLTLVYDLDGPDLGRQLRLEFVRWALASAVVVRPAGGGPAVVVEVIVAPPTAPGVKGAAAGTGP